MLQVMGPGKQLIEMSGVIRAEIGEVMTRKKHWDERNIPLPAVPITMNK